MDIVKDFWFEALSPEAFTVLNREWPHWSGVHPASPISNITTNSRLVLNSYKNFMGTRSVSRFTPFPVKGVINKVAEFSQQYRKSLHRLHQKRKGHGAASKLHAWSWEVRSFSSIREPSSPLCEFVDHHLWLKEFTRAKQHMQLVNGITLCPNK